MALTETWLKQETAIDHFCPPGYCIYRTDRQDGRIGGGALLLVSQDLQQSQGPSVITPNIQAASCTITNKFHKMGVITVYRSPKSTKEDDDILISVISNFSKLVDKFLIVGDLNAPEIDWSLDTAFYSSFGDILLKLVGENSLIQHVDQPTRWRSNQSSNILDLIITKFLNDINTVEYQAPAGKSNHCVLKFTFDLNVTQAPDKYRRSFQNMDLPALLKEATTYKWPCSLETNVDTIWTNIKSNILKLTNKFAPLRRIRRGGKPPW